MEIAKVIRRWQAGPDPQQIALGTGLSRNTVRKYLAAARAMGIAKDGPPPGEEQLSLLVVISQSGPRRVETPRQDALERWADYIYQWLAGDRLQMTRIHELLAARGCSVSYPSLRRLETISKLVTGREPSFLRKQESSAFFCSLAYFSGALEF